MNNGQSTYRRPDEMPDDLRRELEELDAAQARSLRQIWELTGRTTPHHSVSGKSRVRRYVFTSIEQPSARPSLYSLKQAAAVLPLRLHAIAAALIVLIAVSFILSPSVNSVRAPLGTITGTETELPDGTTVALAPGARLFYTDAFGAESRTVHLHGEAFFDVEAAPVPFDIHSFDATTTVLGTSFNVKAWPSGLEPETVVHVRSGTVRVASSESPIDITLLPGQAARTTPDAEESLRQLGSVDVGAALAWKTGGFFFSNEPVGDALSEISRRFDVRIDAPASIRLRRISIHKQLVADPAVLLGDISDALGVRYRRTANGFQMYLK